ncbi:hypothetical protein G7Z17_g7255 [Cylindrodendrum hubeiense]|uniref:Transcription elongation factor Eaf N-terminal domain-containing protein n=1 Tax=Cylindrodendrum hubeiense TaxID=595255 RepID=A0A9P5HDK5_9HYPO|nr:hypothetical protein G7Z17_g7255 [Cylindrodendrum hubeiense]
MALAGLIDPTKTGKYPVVLGDGLLMGKDANDIFTGIRYNHKPALSSSSAPNSARLKPSVPGQTASYDLTYTDDNSKYSFSGPRNTTDNQYVLYFDSERQVFVLDKVDSTFNMNVTSLPDNSDTESLRRQYPQIDNASRPPPPKASKPANKPVSKPASKPVSKPASGAEKPAPKPRAKPPVQKKEVKRKPEKKQPPKSIALSLPVPEPSKPQPESQPKRRSLDEDEDEDEDDDGGLLVEYPGADPRAAAHQTNFSPAFPSVRRFDDFMNQRESEGDDADGEEDDEPDMDFKLPSPVNHHVHQSAPEPMDEDMDDDAGGADLEDDLEKEMEIAFEDLENSQEGSPEGSPDGDESEISEED